MCKKICGFFNRFSDYHLLVLRLPLGLIFIGHGSQKLLGAFGGKGIIAFSGFIESLGLPFPVLMAWIAAIAELAGGIMVLTGFYARLGALGLVGVMGVAIWKVHWVNGLLAQGGYAFPLALLAMSLSILFAGSGKCSVKNV